MATAAPPPMAAPATDPSKSHDVARVLIHDVTWEEYELFLKAMGNRHVFLTYDQGELEIMSPLRLHENAAEALAVMIPILLRTMQIDFKRGGMQTFKRKDLERGFEPDKCWCGSLITRT